MSFHYRELAIQVQTPGLNMNEEGTCTTWTKPSCVDASVSFNVDEHRNGHLAYLKQQLRQAVEQA